MKTRPNIAQHKKPLRLSHYPFSTLFVISVALGGLLSIIFKLINFKGMNHGVDLNQATPIAGSNASYLQINKALQEDPAIFTSHPKNGRLYMDQDLLESLSVDVARKMIAHVEQMLQYMAKDPYLKEKIYRVFKPKNFIVVIVRDEKRLQKSSTTYDPKSNQLSIYDTSFLSRASLLRLKAGLYRVIHQINIFRCRGDGSLYPFFDEDDYFALANAVRKCDARRISTWKNLRDKKLQGSIKQDELQTLDRLTTILEKYTPKLIPSILTGSEKKIISLLKDLQQNKIVEIDRLHLAEIIKYQDLWIGWGTFYPANHPLKNESNALASIYDTEWRLANFPKMLAPIATESGLNTNEFVLQEHDADIHMEPEYTEELCQELIQYHRNKFGGCK